MSKKTGKTTFETLSAKQQAFVDEYLVDLNGKQAAIRAGYSEKAAAPQAARLLTKANVAAAIAERKAARSQRLQIDADWVLERLAREVEADLADLYHEEGGLKDIHEWPEEFRKGLVAGLDVESMKDEGKTIGTISKVRLSDRLKRLELIGKHIGVQAFREQVQQTGNVTLNVSKEDAEL